MILHVTNGDIVAERLSRLGVRGVILPWREILHEGPRAPYRSFDTAGRSLFNMVRAEFIVGQGWVDDGVESHRTVRIAELLFDMDQRDALLLERPWDEIVLWFERDLYDQLLMAQILTLLVGSGRFCQPGIALAYSDHHLSMLPDHELLSRLDRRSWIDTSMADQYQRFFEAFARGEVPPSDPAAPSALNAAADRLRELVPDEHGSSAFDRRVLDRVKRSGAIGVHALLELFNREDGDDAFWSDLAFRSRLIDLSMRDHHLQVLGDTVSWNEP